MTSEFLQKNKKIIITVVVIIALLIGAFAAGRYTLPAKVVEKVVTQVVEKEVVKTVVQKQVVVKKVYVRAVAKNVESDTVTTKRPDGTVVTETKVVDLTKVNVSNTDTQASSMVAIKDETKTETAKTESLKVVENQKAQWHLRVDAGAGARFIGQPLAPVLVLGVGAERRILGPFFVGLWAQTALDMLAPSKPPYQVAGGLTLAVEL